MKVWRGLTTLIFAYGFSVVALAKEPLFSFHVEGSPSASSRYTNLTLKIQGGAPKAIRFYSEPSHTLLAAFLDNSEGHAESQSWFEGVVPAGAQQVVQMPLLPGSEISFQGPRPPSADIAIHVHTRFRDAENSATDELFKMTVNVLNFNFGLEAYPRAARSADRRIANEEDGPTYTVRCGPADGSTCEFATASCAGDSNVGRCCWETRPESGCGWCGKRVAECLPDPCPNC